MIAILIAGCGTKAPTSSSSPDPAGISEPWFCQLSAAGADWECVRSAEKVANPKPVRLPEAARAASPEPSPGPSTAASTQSVPATEMPADAASSDKGDEAGSILDLPADYIAVQLIAMPSQASLDKFTARHRLHGLSAARVLADEQIRYVLLLGIYATRDEAEAAAAAAPPPFDSRDLWLRDVGSLQQAIRAADP